MPEDREKIKLQSLKGKFFGAYLRNLDRNRAFYERRFVPDVLPSIEAQEDIWPLIPPTARHAIDEAANHILTRPRIKVPVRPSQDKQLENQQNAEIKRQFLNGWWDQVSDRHNIIGDARPLLLNEGRIAVRKLLRWDLIPDKPEGSKRSKEWKRYKDALARLGELDFIWQVDILDNATVFEDPSNPRDPKYIFLEYDILVEDAKARFPDAEGQWTRLDDHDYVTYMEYWSAPKFDPSGDWTEGEYKIWVDETRVHNGVNPYPYIPVAVEDAGFGISRQGIPLEERYVGMTQHMQDIFIAEARQMTSVEAVSEIIAFPPIFARNVEEGKEIVVGPKRIIRLDGAEDDPNRESLEIGQWPEVPLTVQQLIAKTTEIANRTVKTDTLGGVPLRGVETATEADQQIRNATAKLGPPVEALQRLIVKLSRWVLMDIELVLEAPVTVYGAGEETTTPAEITLSPREISGFYNLAAELRTSDRDAIDQVKARFWAELYRVLPTLSAVTAMERGEISDSPLQEIVRRLSEDVMFSERFALIRELVGAESFQELTRLVEAEQNSPSPPAGSGRTAGANSAGGLVTQDSITSPVQEGIRRDGLSRRDLLRGDSQLRA